MNPFVEILIGLLFLTVGDAVIIISLRMTSGKNNTHKLFLWLNPGFATAILYLYVVGRLGAIQNLIPALILTGIAVFVILANFLLVGRMLISNILPIISRSPPPN